MLMGLRAEKSLESQSCFGVTPPLHSQIRPRVSYILLTLYIFLEREKD